MMNLQLTILTVLRNADGLMLPKATLSAEATLLSPRTTLGDIDAAIRSLESAREITGVANSDVPGGSRWRITDAGKARLAEANL